MIKCVYKLNAPPLADILKPGIIDTEFPNSNTFLYSGHRAVDFLKPEYLNWHNFLWNSIALFYKPNGHRGNIHTDTVIDDNPWGINWIMGGHGVMEYWDSSTITGKVVTKDIKDYAICQYNTIQRPDAVYSMTEGAYLVNGAQPHRATGFKNRYAFSLRCISRFNMKWDDVVKEFSDIIID